MEKNYLVINAFVKDEKFTSLYKRLKDEFSAYGEQLEILDNISARTLLKTDGHCHPILFWDKDVYLASLLQKSGYMLINSSKAIEICDDKAKTYLALEGIVNMPETIIAPFTFDSVGYDDYGFLDEVIDKLGFPMVVKQVKGSFGERVFLANSRTELLGIFKNLHSSGVIFQKYIKSSHGKDVRVYVVGNKVSACALRENVSDFRSNVAQGGSMKPLVLPKEYADIAVRAVSEVGAFFAGVDLLIGENGEPLLCEVNSNAHFAGLEKNTGANVAKDIVSLYLSYKEN